MEVRPKEEIIPQGFSAAYFAGGCFWCTEALFQSLRGVAGVTPGYAGGTVPHPSYDAVSTGQTGHAESVRIAYDPSVISYEDLLNVFFHVHDPTTRDRQGPDIGTQYRSAIFYATDEQGDIARKFVADLETAHAYDRPIVTEIVPLTAFYSAESYHDDYYRTHSGDPYCSLVIAPKLAALEKRFADLLAEKVVDAIDVAGE